MTVLSLNTIITSVPIIHVLVGLIPHEIQLFEVDGTATMTTKSVEFTVMYT
jgi:hypothetical protein